MSSCWAWTVSVMATCTNFFTDLRSSPLSVCNEALDPENVTSGGLSGPYSLAVYQAGQGRVSNSSACVASHGQCNEHCALEFGVLWGDAECGEWLQDYVRFSLSRTIWQLS